MAPPCCHLTGSTEDSNTIPRVLLQRVDTSVGMRTGESINPGCLNYNWALEQVQCLMLEKQNLCWRFVVVSESAQERENRSFLHRVALATFCHVFPCFVCTKRENVQDSMNESRFTCCCRTYRNRALLVTAEQCQHSLRAYRNSKTPNFLQRPKSTVWGALGKYMPFLCLVNALYFVLHFQL